MAEYYITCAGASPFAEAVATIDTDFTSAADELLLLKSYSTVGLVAGVEIDALQDGMNVLKTALLVNDNDDNAVCGLFHETDCTVVNARYQALINGICGGFMEPLSRIFETFISFAAALSILEFLRRLVSGTEHELPGESGDGSDDDDDECVKVHVVHGQNMCEYIVWDTQFADPNANPNADQGSAALKEAADYADTWPDVNDVI